MTLEEEHRALREHLAQREARIQQVETLLGEQQRLLQEMQGQVETLTRQVKEWQARLAKKSHKSSLPPSSDRFVRQPKSLRKRSEKKPGGQEGHPGTTLRFPTSPDEVLEYRVTVCASCQQDVREVEACVTLRRHVVDIPAPRLLVQEHRAEHQRCPRCQHLTQASFPATVTAPIPDGPLIGAAAVSLTHQQLVPLERTGEVLSDLLGVQMSEGTIGDLSKRTAGHLAPVEQQRKEALRQAPVMHQDETGVWVAGKRYGEHVTCTNTLTHSQVDPHRGQAALKVIGIVPGFQGISIHDAWGSSFRSDGEHAFCLVHVLRALVFQAEEQGAPWAADLIDLLVSMKQATQQARDQGKHWLDPLEVLAWEQAFLGVLDDGDRVTPRATAPPGRKGRIKQRAARNLLDRLRKHQQAVFCFLEDLRVDVDNNLAERDLRMLKVQQKVSGCFRTVAGAQAFRRIRGSLSTLRTQGLPLLSALQATLGGHPLLPSFA